MNTSQLPDSDFVSAAINGDNEAFIQLVQRHDEALRAVAYSVLGSADSMDDVLQQSLLKAFRSIKSAKPTSPRAWLCRIVHNTAIDHIRRNAKLVSIDSAELADTPSTAAEHTDRIATGLLVNRILNQLPDSQRIALRLIDGEQMPYAEVAELLSIPVGTLATRVRTARIAFRNLLDAQDKDA